MPISLKLLMLSLTAEMETSRVEDTMPGYTFRMIFTVALAAISFSICYGQGAAGVTYDIDSTFVPTVEAGQTLHLTLRARDERDSTVENWDSVGKDVNLTIRGSLAETDTSTRSWNRRSRAFSWIHITVGTDALPLDSIGVSEPTPLLYYTIPKEVFVRGHATLSFTQSRADTGIVLSLSPRWSFLTQESPPLDFTPGPPENFLVEITSQTGNVNEVYLLTRYEVVVTQRDRYLNPLPDSTISVQLTARFPTEFDQNMPGLDNVFDDPVPVHGPTSFIVASRAARPDTIYWQNREKQWIIARSISDSVISGRSAPYAILNHPPNPFSLLAPEDETLFKLRQSTTEEVFSWEEAQPRDPVHNIRISRFDTAWTYSDEVRYGVRVLDALTLTRSVLVESDEHGEAPRWTATHKALKDILDQLSRFHSPQEEEMVWLVEATDGLYTIWSRPSSEQQPGRRMTVNKYLYSEVPDAVDIPPVSRAFTLHQNYPNPFHSSTEVAVTLHTSGHCMIRVHDILGETVAALHEGFLEAGTHRFTFDSDMLPKGVYVYRVAMDGDSRTRSMLLR
ncbi:MAG: T9SS type A sorting domain-containing protein [Bacteroidota bacterium]|nr:T9SS type A sorting domain-containing protein [Bacteroidota bacterium]